MAAPAHTTPDAQDPPATADPIALAAFVSRRGGRVLAYLDAVTEPDRALQAAGEAFAAFRLARAADPDAEAAATTLLRATRRAATAHAENPYRPAGRDRPARRTAACDAMPRLLVAWTEGRLPDPDVDRLVEHLQACPDCRALRDAFDRAELGYRGGRTVDLDGTEVGVIATAMALAVTGGPSAPAAPSEDATTQDRRDRPASRTSSDPAHTDGTPRRTSLPSVGRRTQVPPPPTAIPDRPSVRTARPTPSGRPTAIPERPTRIPDRSPDTDDVAEVGFATPDRPHAAEECRPDTPPAGTTGRGDAETVDPPRRRPDDPDDPLGPEALGYAVPRPGLPRPARRPAVPRVRPRRRRRPPSAAVSAATGDAPPTSPPEGAIAASPGTGSRPRPGDAVTRDEAAAGPRDGAPTPAPGIASNGHGTGASDRGTSAGSDDGAPAPSPDRSPAGDGSGDRTPTSSVPPATVTPGGPAVSGRRFLDAPIVRQLGVPAVLLLVVLVVALIAAGVFAGEQAETVAPITRPTIPTVPADPSDIPALRP